MLDTSARLLALLGLLQSRPAWTGPELADRLGVTVRTVRNDVARLRALDYPVEATRGAAGAYRLGPGGKLPPLLLDDEEAVAVAIGLRGATGIAGIAESSTRALTKLEQVLPSRLRATVEAVDAAVDHAPENTDTDAADPAVDPAVLRAVATAIQRREWLRPTYRGEPRLVEPYRLLAWQRRWYLVGRDPREDTWHTLRIDWLTPGHPTGRRFEPHPVPGGDWTAFMMRDVASSGWAVHARLRIDSPADDVLAHINPAVGVVEAVDASTSVLVTGADSLATVAVYVGMLGMDFVVESPAELVEHLDRLAGVYARAARRSRGDAR
ncbi:helix-turn-helix transcriptional regulator [Oerskovia flava]|uniref:helix-turn-helix transcriptional regulator n=1 Tax=Oerskovia flava TaxID=2986422 RepID=UPI00223F10C1|nr:WYL domain-containing protein [Oerskovia sp. JB1-3-2]